MLRNMVSVSRLRWLPGSSVNASSEKPTRISAASAAPAKVSKPEASPHSVSVFKSFMVILWVDGQSMSRILAVVRNPESTEHASLKCGGSHRVMDSGDRSDRNDSGNP